VPFLLAATKIVEPLYIIYPGFEYMTRSFASVVVDVAAKASPVYSTLDVAVAT
jgi:deoxyxylulose-5-phosphate synthase